MANVKRAIITGATGAIGTALIENFIENGIVTLVLLRKDSPRNAVIPEHPLVVKKYCALDELAGAENDTGEQYDVFYHFAWAGTSGAERQNMQLQLKNIQYALDALALAKKYGCHTFIGAGSQAEYGRVEGKLTPDTPAFPENGYGIAKLCAGYMTRELAAQLGIKHIWTRILSVYGPNDNPKSMIPTAIEQWRNGKRTAFTKGEQLWDYLFSKDAAEAFRLIGEKGVGGKTYVLGSGKAVPLADYILCAAKALNAQELVDLGALPYAEKQVMHLQADITEMTRDTGWTPKTSFEEGIRCTIQAAMNKN